MRGYGDDPTGRRVLAAPDRRVDERGLVTGVSGAPDVDRPGTSPEAQAFHLLAHTALTRYAPGR